MSLPERVRRTIHKHTLVGANARVLVALSGGPDSVALLHLLLELQQAGELTVAGLAHFNHQLRGVDADEDESFCRTMAESLGLPLDVARADVRTVARETRRSVEDVARELRYAFFDEAAARAGADAVAVGHSRDDQAETFLLRLMRGAGARGLAAILPRAGRVIRPLLEISREELRKYAADRQLPFRSDASNDDLSIPRNRVRHELIPYLEREFSPGIRAVLAREAAVARDDEDRLQAEAVDLARSIVLTTTGGKTELDAAALSSLHPALAARVVRAALARQAPGRFIGFDHVDRVLACAQGTHRGAIDLPGQRAVRRGGVIVLGPPRPRRREDRRENSFRYSLSIPGEVTIDNLGWSVSAERLEAAGTASRGQTGLALAPEVMVAADPLKLPLAIRSRRAGDRFSPLGLGHRKKLQDFLVDRKIPREMRDSLPLVVDGQDRIVWVVGESMAEDFRVTEPSQGVILLKARRLGGLG
jgi:tRNA(Ile)-lysidine synthase